MANLVSSKGYTSSSRGADAPGAYSIVLAQDFGQLGGAAPALAYNAGQGSLGSGTARCCVTWVTAYGESLPSAEATVSISAGSGAFTATMPTVPTNGAAVVGWRVYSSSGGAGSCLLNAAGTTQTMSSFTVNVLGGGTTTINAFPIATTAVQVQTYGAGQAEQVASMSGIQFPLPSVSANSSYDYPVIVPNSGSLWRVSKPVSFARPNQVVDTTGVVAATCDVIQPMYPGVSQSVTAGFGISALMSLNGYLYWCTTSGTTASTFIGSGSFNQTKGATTTDGSVVWTSLGKACVIALRFANSSGSASYPVAQEYDFFSK